MEETLRERKNPIARIFTQFTYYKYFYEITLIFVLLVVCFILSLLTPHFLTTSNMLNILQQVSITAIVAFGMAFVIISQGIDLSVGAGIALVGIPVATIIIEGGGSPAYMALGIISGILLGALIGFINGVNIVHLKMAPFYRHPGDDVDLPWSSSSRLLKGSLSLDCPRATFSSGTDL